MEFKNRADWLKWRHKGFGGSDAPCLWNASKWKTRYELGEEKLLPEPRVEEAASWAAQKGINQEIESRKTFAALYNIEHGTDETFDSACLEMADFPFMKCSLDGISRDGTVIWECKRMSDPPTPGKDLTEGQKRHLNVKSGAIPLDYLMQVQHNLLVSGARECHFTSDDGETQYTTVIVPDPEFQKKHFDRCVEAWQLIENGQSQPISEKDYKELRAKGIVEKVRKWSQLKACVEEAEKQMDALRAEIISSASDANHPRLKVGDVKIIFQEGRSGGVDWERAFMYLARASGNGDEKVVERYKKEFKKPDGKPSWRLG